jgi:hypothetical protein
MSTDFEYDHGERKLAACSLRLPAANILGEFTSDGGRRSRPAGYRTVQAGSLRSPWQKVATLL